MILSVLFDQSAGTSKNPFIGNLIESLRRVNEINLMEAFNEFSSISNVYEY